MNPVSSHQRITVNMEFGPNDDFVNNNVQIKPEVKEKKLNDSEMDDEDPAPLPPNKKKEVAPERLRTDYREEGERPNPLTLMKQPSQP